MSLRGYFRSWGMLACACLGGGWPAFAETPPAPTMPTSMELTMQVRQSLSLGTAYLKGLAEKQEHGLVVAPFVEGTRKVASTETYTYTVKYREEKRTRQVPIYEYETYEEFVYVGRNQAEYDYVGANATDSARTLQKVKKQRVKGIKGYQEVHDTVLVRDDSGPIERSYTGTRYTYEKGNDRVVWPVGMLGYNGVALYALLQAGVAPDEEWLHGLARTLQVYVEAYGMPDTTMDLAGLVVGLCRLPTQDERLDALRTRLVSKLLAGQVNQGGASGLWGPVCQDVDLLAALMKEELRLNRELGEVKAEAAARPKSRLLADKVFNGEEERRELLAIFKNISVRAQKLEDITAGMTADPPFNFKPPADFPRILERVYLAPITVDFTKFQTGDLESTAWAVFALRVAKQHGWLPESVQRAKLGKREVLPAVPLSATWQRLLAALPRAYSPKDAYWTEGNACSVVTVFEQAVGIKSEERTEFPLRHTRRAVNDAYAFAIMRSLAEILGDMPAERLNRVLTDSTMQLNAAHLADFANDQRKGLSRQPWPYDMLLFLSGFDRDLGGVWSQRRDLYLQAAWLLIRQQAADGSWGDKQRYIHLASSARALSTEQYIDAKVRHGQGAQFNTDEFRAKFEADWYSRWAWPYFQVVGAPVYTSLAMTFLADSVRPPVCAWWQLLPGTAAPQMLDPGLQQLQRSQGVTLSYTQFPAAIPERALYLLPALVMTGNGVLSEGQKTLLEPLRPWLADDGLLVVETAATGDGRTFADSLTSALAAFEPGCKLGPIPTGRVMASEASLGDLKLLGIQTPGGRVLAVIMPVGPRNGDFAHTRTRAAAVLAAILRKRVPEYVLASDYAKVEVLSVTPSN
jgi:hypothetical protein